MAPPVRNTDSNQRNQQENRNASHRSHRHRTYHLQSSLGTSVNDALGMIGLKGGLIGASIDALAGDPIGALQNLQDAFQETAQGRGTNALERRTGHAVPALQVLPPQIALSRYTPIAQHT